LFVLFCVIEGIVKQASKPDREYYSYCKYNDGADYDKTARPLPPSSPQEDSRPQQHKKSGFPLRRRCAVGRKADDDTVCAGQR